MVRPHSQAPSALIARQELTAGTSEVGGCRSPVARTPADALLSPSYGVALCGENLRTGSWLALEMVAVLAITIGIISWAPFPGPNARARHCLFAVNPMETGETVRWAVGGGPSTG
jgi:hypothetical protein